jgi:hypothetical protein
MSPSAQEEANAASAGELGISVLEYLQIKASASAGAVVDLGRRDQAAPGAQAAGSAAGQRNAEAETPGASRSPVGSPRAAY